MSAAAVSIHAEPGEFISAIFAEYETSAWIEVMCGGQRLTIFARCDATRAQFRAIADAIASSVPKPAPAKRECAT